MIGTAFSQAIHALGDPNDPTGLWPIHRDYILSGNDRGADVIRKMIDHFTGPLDGKRVLDIGCGYGGVCIAAAMAGAQAVGIELGEPELRLSPLNLADHGVQDRVTVHAGDATDLSLMESLGQFDLVICDNVIEHVDDARRLIFNISRALKPNAPCYVTAPNAGSLGQVVAECHNMEFGLSLLNRFDAQALYESRGHGGRYSVGDYFDFNQYIAMFSQNAIAALNIVPVDVSEAALDEARVLAATIADMRATRGGTMIEDRLTQTVDRYLAVFNARLEEITVSVGDQRYLNAVEFSRDYLVQRWEFVGNRRT